MFTCIHTSLPLPAYHCVLRRVVFIRLLVCVRVSAKFNDDDDDRVSTTTNPFILSFHLFMAFGMLDPSFMLDNVRNSHAVQQQQQQQFSSCVVYYYYYHKMENIQ